MANPAQLLFNLLSSWQPQDGRSAAQMRNLDSLEDAVLVAHRRAMGLLSQIDEILDSLIKAGRPLAQYQRQLPEWHKIVLSYPHGWTTQQPPFDITAMVLLETLIDVLNAVVPDTTEAQRQSIDDLCGDVLRMVAEDATIPTELKRHLTAVANHARSCVAEFGVVGDFDLRSAVDRLLVAVQVATRISGDASGWRDVVKTWAYPFTAGLTVALTNDFVQIALGP